MAKNIKKESILDSQEFDSTQPYNRVDATRGESIIFIGSEGGR